MTDLQKRATLKKMGVTGLGLAVAGTPAMAAWQHVNTQNGEAASLFPPVTRGVSDLNIDIFATTSVPESSVVFTNLTDDELVVQHFLPGSVIFGDEYVDLNSVRGDMLIRIPPQGAVSRPVRVTQLSDQPIMEYVWADDAVTRVSKETKVVSLGAFVADRRLVLYPIPSLDVPA